jgi:hypothetical protein
VKVRLLAQTALGFLGVLALVDAVNGFMVVAEALGPGAGDSPGGIALVVGLPVLLLLGLSYILVFHNARLASALAPDAEATIGRGTPNLARLLVALLGSMLLLQTLPRVINLILNLFVAAGDPDIIQGGALRRALISTGVEVACALYLVMRPERFLAFLDRPRAEPVESGESAAV